MSDVKPTSLRWLWPGRIPLGKITLISGDPSAGKSVLSCELAARLTTGREWPDGPACLEPSTVLLACAEDDSEDTIRPRLDAAGADCANVVLIERMNSPAARRPWTLGDVAPLLELLPTLSPRPSTLIIDPISSFIPRGIDSNKDTDVRLLLDPWVGVARENDLAILLIGHFNKTNGSDPASAIYRASGSIAWQATARSSWAVVVDPECEDRRFFAPVKRQLSKCPSTLAYRVISAPSNPAIPMIVWEPAPVQLDAEQLIGSRRGAKGHAQRAASDWLKEKLAPGPVSATDLELEAGQLGFSWRTVQRAKDKLGVLSTKPNGQWWWELPASAGVIRSDASLALPH